MSGFRTGTITRVRPSYFPMGYLEPVACPLNFLAIRSKTRFLRDWASPGTSRGSKNSQCFVSYSRQRIQEEVHREESKRSTRPFDFCPC